jgi:futalosine hydrolase
MPRGLVLVPTELERKELGALGPLELCGFGPVAAAARTAALLAERRPERALLLGIAGTYDRSAADVGAALALGRVEIDGFDGAGFEPWPGIRAAIPLEGRSGRTLVTVLAPSSSPAEAAERARRHPGAIAEDMEGYGVAVACAIARVPLAIVRGISNEAGDRNLEHWRIQDALASACELAQGMLA